MLLSRARRWWRKIARAYYLQCAREDVVKRRLVVPAGVWLCEHCAHVAFDVARLRDHVALAHA